MCWSGEASVLLATVGFSTTAYAVVRKESVALWAPLGYFSLMEALQAYTYVVINECGSQANQIATMLGYLHIVFQPFFCNALSLYFVPKEIRERIQIPVYGLCFFSAIYMLIQLYPFSWAGTCDMRRALCAARLCSVSGNWHIAWEIPFNGIGNWSIGIPLIGLSFFTYGLVMFVLPLLYGSWRVTLYHFVMGPTLASLTTDNKNEWPAVWCLLSIGFLIIVVKTPVRRWLFVSSWPLWPKARYTVRTGQKAPSTAPINIPGQPLANCENGEPLVGKRPLSSA
jgi:hypothetical protein